MQIVSTQLNGNFIQIATEEPSPCCMLFGSEASVNAILASGDEGAFVGG